VEGKASLSGVFQSCLAGFADRWSAAFVFVVGCDVADAGVQSDRVVVRRHDGQFGAQHGWVADREQVRSFGLEVPEQGLDPGLVGRGAGSGRSVGRSR
jgi:hypothetical protein